MPATMPATLIYLLPVALCTLTVWAVVQVVRPEKFSLRRAPGRPNQLSPVHIVAVYLIYLAVAMLILKIAGSLLTAAPGRSASEAALAIGLGLVQWATSGLSVAALAAGAEATHAARSAAQAGAKATVITAIVTPAAMAGACLAVASGAFRHGLGRGLGLSARRLLWDAGRAVVAFLAVVPLCIGAMILMQWLMELGVFPIQPREHPMLVFLVDAGPGWRLAVIVGAVVCAPIGEELFFRGLLQSMLRRMLGGPWRAILVTSAAFAVVHWGQFQDMPALFLLAVALGYSYERTGRVTGPILIHAIFNGVMIWAKLAG
ncbi:hypothetical protein LCGC14_2258560 [marine sediment metagenome]|uniref:CAAX prenyl protease 2/Lysostaphin resistance protein A-like domain-containing protein n=1 Tax=marine sediment metagenome TaxID=412755 RepID=A0A0F9D0D0_9ZZZZ